MRVLVELEIEKLAKFKDALSLGAAHALTEVHIHDIATKPEEFTAFFSRITARHKLVWCPKPRVLRVRKRKPKPDSEDTE